MKFTYMLSAEEVAILGRVRSAIISDVQRSSEARGISTYQDVAASAQRCSAIADITRALVDNLKMQGIDP